MTGDGLPALEPFICSPKKVTTLMQLSLGIIVKLLNVSKNNVLMREENPHH